MARKKKPLNQRKTVDIKLMIYPCEPARHGEIFGRVRCDMPGAPREFNNPDGKPFSNPGQMLDLIIKASRGTIRSMKKRGVI